MKNPDKPHGYKWRRVTADRLVGRVGWNGPKVTREERPCDVCGGSRRNVAHGASGWPKHWSGSWT